MKQPSDFHLWQEFCKTCDEVLAPKETIIVKTAKTVTIKPKLLSGSPKLPASDYSAANIEPKIYKKLQTGKIPIARYLDLHFYTGEQSYKLLLSFLEKAYNDNIRYVLIIVGKGKSFQGFLQINVPRWLETKPMSVYVNASAKAAPCHGGEGALYVRLRKKL